MDGKTPDEKAADAIALTFQGGIITPGEFIDGYFTCGDSVVKGDPADDKPKYLPFGSDPDDDDGDDDDDCTPIVVEVK